MDQGRGSFKEEFFRARKEYETILCRAAGVAFGSE